MAGIYAQNACMRSLIIIPRNAVKWLKLSTLSSIFISVLRRFWGLCFTSILGSSFYVDFGVFVLRWLWGLCSMIILGSLFYDNFGVFVFTSFLESLFYVDFGIYVLIKFVVFVLRWFWGLCLTWILGSLFYVEFGVFVLCLYRFVIHCFCDIRRFWFDVLRMKFWPADLVCTLHYTATFNYAFVFSTILYRKQIL